MTEKYSQLTEPLIDKGPTDDSPPVGEELTNDMKNDNYIVQLPNLESEEYNHKIINDAVSAFIFVQEKQRLIILVGAKESGNSKYLVQFTIPDCTKVSEQYLSDYRDYNFGQLTHLYSEYISFTVTDEFGVSKLTIAKIDEFFYDQTCYIINHQSTTNILKIDFPNSILCYDHTTQQFTKRQIELDNFQSQDNNQQKVINIDDLPIISQITHDKYLRSNDEHLKHLWTLSLNYELIIDNTSKLLLLIDFKNDKIKQCPFQQDESLLRILDQERILLVSEKSIRFHKISYFFVDSDLKEELDADKGYFELTKIFQDNFMADFELTSSGIFPSGQPCVNGNYFYYFSKGLLTMYDLANKSQVWQQDIPSHGENRVIQIHDSEYILYLNENSQLLSSLIKKQQPIITPIHVDYFNEKKQISKSTIFVDDCSYSYYHNGKIQFVQTKTRKHHQFQFDSEISVRSLRYIEELELVLVFTDSSINLMKLNDKSYNLKEILNVECDEGSYYLRGCELYMIDTTNSAFLKIKIRSDTDFDIITLNSDIDVFYLKYMNQEQQFFAYQKEDSTIYFMDLNGLPQTENTLIGKYNLLLKY